LLQSRTGRGGKKTIRGRAARVRDPDVTGYSFRLYVTAETISSREAIRNLRELCDARLRDGYELEVIDVLERPEVAEKERIIATPTVVRLSPGPVQRVIGDLSDPGLAALALGLPPTDPAASTGATE